MRKALIVAPPLVSLGVLVSVESAAARITCEEICTQRAPAGGGYAKCLHAKKVCSNQGPGAPRTIQEQKTTRTK
jgi:hypothetical protein